MGEVESQLVGADRRARLPDVSAKPFPQRGVQQVGRGVVAHGGVAKLVIHACLDGLSGVESRESRDADRLVVPDPIHVLDDRLASIDREHPESATWPPPSA